jgi:hypothetical protein
VARRVRVLLEAVQFSVFWHLSDELLEASRASDLLSSPSLLLALQLALSAGFHQLLLLFSLPLHVALHVCDLGLDKAQLLVQLQVVLALLLLPRLPLLPQGWHARVLAELPPLARLAQLGRWVLPLLALSGWLFLLVVCQSAIPRRSVGTRSIILPEPVDVRRVVLPGLPTALQSRFDGLISAGRALPLAVAAGKLLIGPAVLVGLSGSHSNIIKKVFTHSAY